MIKALLRTEFIEHGTGHFVGAFVHTFPDAAHLCQWPVPQLGWKVKINGYTYNVVAVMLDIDGEKATVAVVRQ